MKICIYGDNHWSQYSSIVRKRGKKYSLRLENQLKSLFWVNAMAIQHKCDTIVCLGDFFDRAELNSEEITALKDLSFSPNIAYIQLVGNHEMGLGNLHYNSASLFNLTNTKIIESACTWRIDDHTELCFLPYILEDNRQPLDHYFSPSARTKTRIIFSHNDIKGMQLGAFTSKDGFDIEDIESNCDLFINGHLHNGGKVTDKIINCGNLTGQNFSEDASLYTHRILILDTETNAIEEIENPFAFNFYKIDTSMGVKDLSTIITKPNAVVTLKTKVDEADYWREVCSHDTNIVESRIIIIPEVVKADTNLEAELVSVDHLKQFTSFAINKLGDSPIVQAELQEVLK